MITHYNVLPVGFDSHLDFFRYINKEFNGNLPSTILYVEPSNNKVKIDLSVMWLKAMCFNELSKVMDFKPEEWMLIKQALRQSFHTIDSGLEQKINKATELAIRLENR